MKHLISAVILALACAACGSNHDASVSTLKKSGFTDIQTTGWAPFSCSNSDTYSTGFRAKNAQGTPVEGVVCCGLLKSCTVRF